MLYTSPHRISAEDLALVQQRADAARQSPFWPFGPLTPQQQRARAAQVRALQAQAIRTAPGALW